MPHTVPLTPAFTPLQEAVRGWSEDQKRIEAELQESFDALEAMESQLEAWRVSLLGERQALEDERNDFERLQADQAGGLEENQRLAADLAAAVEGSDSLREELQASEDKATDLEARVLTLEDELRAAKKQEARLADQLESRKAEMAEQRTRWEEDFRRLRDLLQQPTPESGADVVDQAGNPGQEEQPEAAAAPAVGSVVAQFGKLREQQAGRRAKKRAEN